MNDELLPFLEQIAQKHLLLDNLIEVGDDAQDVYDCPKACIREALREAFLAGAAWGRYTQAA